MATIDELVEAIAALDLLDAYRAVDALRAKLGVEAGVDDLGSVGGAYGAPSFVERDWGFNVMLEAVGPHRLRVVRVVRELTPGGLNEALAMLDRLPLRVAQTFGRTEANEIATRLRDAGATVTVVSAEPA